MLYSQGMQEYELVVVTQSKGNDILGQVKKLVENAKGKVDKVMEWGEKPLAYPIKKQTSASFFLLNLSSSPANISRLDGQLRINENILRHLLIRKESKLKSESKLKRATKKKSK